MKWALNHYLAVKDGVKVPPNCKWPNNAKLCQMKTQKRGNQNKH